MQESKFAWLWTEFSQEPLALYSKLKVGSMIHNLFNYLTCCHENFDLNISRYQINNNIKLALLQLNFDFRQDIEHPRKYRKFQKQNLDE